MEESKEGKEDDEYGKDEVSGGVDLFKIKSKKSFFQFLWQFFLFIVLVVSVGFFLFSAFKIKTKLYDSLSGSDNDFSQLSDSISKKNLPDVSTKIKSFYEKTNTGELVLQSIGQDIFVLNLLYPKTDKPRITVLIDSFRAAHILVYSYKNISETNFEKKSNSGEYLSGINSTLDAFYSSKEELKKRIIFANFYSKEAKNIIERSKTKNDSNKNDIQEKISSFSEVSYDFFRYLTNVPDELADGFGQNGKKSYLILFLNNAEIRPGGGFIGSFARLDFENGKLNKIDFEKNIYTLDKSFLSAGNHIEPPEELKSLTGDWTMRDSNLFADFRESAKKTSWFYEQESKQEIDGVFAIDTTFFRNLLDITGPISMPEYNLEIGSSNFLSDVQYQVEIGYFRDAENKVENQPKKILADLLPKFLDEIFKPNHQKDLSETIAKSISEKHFLMYFENIKIEDLVIGIGAGGEILKNESDYLYVSDTNIAGYKSSLNVAQSINQEIEIDDVGNSNEKISILRKHNGSFEWPDGVNNNFTKIYLPLFVKVDKVNLISGDNNPRSDPKLATNDKYKIGIDLGKTVVSFWQNTKPNEESKTEIEYTRREAVKLFGDQFNYDITIQKQPGMEKSEYNLFFTYPFGFEPKNVTGFDQINRKIYLKKTITSDEKIHLEFVRSGSTE